MYYVILGPEYFSFTFREIWKKWRKKSSRPQRQQYTSNVHSLFKWKGISISKYLNKVTIAE